MESKRCYGCMQYKEDGPFCEHCGYDERRQNAPHQLPAGTVLQGKYLIGRVLGQGGFGITYLGLDMTLDIPVAIKEYYPTGVVTRECSYSHSVTLATGESDTRFVENRDRFLREARILAKLQDVPEVVRIKTFFTAVKNNKFGAAEFIVNKATHICIVVFKCVYICKHHFLIDNPIFRNSFVEII